MNKIGIKEGQGNHIFLQHKAVSQAIWVLQFAGSCNQHQDATVTWI